MHRCVLSSALVLLLAACAGGSGGDASTGSADTTVATVATSAASDADGAGDDFDPASIPVDIAPGDFDAVTGDAEIVELPRSPLSDVGTIRVALPDGWQVDDVRTDAIYLVPIGNAGTFEGPEILLEARQAFREADQPRDAFARVQADWANDFQLAGVPLHEHELSDGWIGVTEAWTERGVLVFMLRAAPGNEYVLRCVGLTGSDSSLADLIASVCQSWTGDFPSDPVETEPAATGESESDTTEPITTELVTAESTPLPDAGGAEPTPTASSMTFDVVANDGTALVVTAAIPDGWVFDPTFSRWSPPVPGTVPFGSISFYVHCEPCGPQDWETTLNAPDGAIADFREWDGEIEIDEATADGWVVSQIDRGDLSRRLWRFDDSASHPFVCMVNADLNDDGGPELAAELIEICESATPDWL